MKKLLLITLIALATSNTGFLRKLTAISITVTSSEFTGEVCTTNEKLPFTLTVESIEDATSSLSSSVTIGGITIKNSATNTAADTATCTIPQGASTSISCEADTGVSANGPYTASLAEAKSDTDDADTAKFTLPIFSVTGSIGYSSKTRVAPTSPQTDQVIDYSSATEYKFTVSFVSALSDDALPTITINDKNPTCSIDSSDNTSKTLLCKMSSATDLPAGEDGASVVYTAKITSVCGVEEATTVKVTAKGTKSSETGGNTGGNTGGSTSGTAATLTVSAVDFGAVCVSEASLKFDLKVSPNTTAANSFSKVKLVKTTNTSKTIGATCSNTETTDTISCSASLEEGAYYATAEEEKSTDTLSAFTISTTQIGYTSTAVTRIAPDTQKDQTVDYSKDSPYTFTVVFEKNLTDTTKPTITINDINPECSVDSTTKTNLICTITKDKVPCGDDGKAKEYTATITSLCGAVESTTVKVSVSAARFANVSRFALFLLTLLFL